MTTAHAIPSPEADQKLLFVADSGSQIELRRALLLNPDINARDPFDYHRTALMKAARVGDFGGVMILLRRGAEFLLADDNNKRAIDLTSSLRIKRCLRLLAYLTAQKSARTHSKSHETHQGQRLGRVKTPGLSPRFASKAAKKSKDKSPEERPKSDGVRPSA